MPGVVAGFPRAPAAGGIVMTTENFPYEPGLIPTAAFDKYYPLGGLAPAFASIIPNAPAVEGAAGEILGFYCAGVAPGQFELYFWCQGSFSTAPFSSVTIDGQLFPASMFSPFAFEDGTTSFDPVGTVASNVLAPGLHTLVFS